MFAVWQDGNVHSENPYTQAIGNPILDYYLKLNIVHNLHHAYPNSPKYMIVYKWDHLYSSKDRNDDIQFYNKIMKTNVNFSFFL